MTWLALAIALLVPQVVDRDVAYGEDPRHRLDLFVPAHSNFATVIFVHGGSLTSGDKADGDYANVCRPLPSAGYGCASINYRLAPKHAWPSQPDDVAASVAWIRKQIASRGGDPSRIFLFGHSSGAALVALVASDERYLARHALTLADLRGVIAMGSIMWDDDLEQAIAQRGEARVEERFRQVMQNGPHPSLAAYRDSWPIRHVRRGMPPFLFLIAEAEQENPPVLRTNKKFIDDMQALGNYGEHEVLAGRTHSTAIRQFHEPGDPVFLRVVKFLRQFSK